ncbi:hypothetical protein CEXT_322981 [Caerostris extrusa]|uniref:Uncharacterized protein n=1 Tax=Caerostris extrusa TaxID=172846 RepID=A0AAV4N1H0_CAEEX|nr:hypothetical protein CEXT_322981 [Caerostris extrusa]
MSSGRRRFHLRDPKAMAVEIGMYGRQERKQVRGPPAMTAVAVTRVSDSAGSIDTSEKAEEVAATGELEILIFTTSPPLKQNSQIRGSHYCKYIKRKKKVVQNKDVPQEEATHRQSGRTLFMTCIIHKHITVSNLAYLSLTL